MHGSEGTEKDTVWDTPSIDPNRKGIITNGKSLSFNNLIKLL